MKPKRQLLAVVTFVALIVLVQACRKFNFLAEETKPPAFTVAEAKEWYYGVFKKSDEYINSLPGNKVEGILNQGTGSSNNPYPTIKYPYWNLGLEQNSANWEIVELPIMYTLNKIILPGTSQMSAADREKVYKGISNRLLIMRNAGGIITTRILNYIPDKAYLAMKGGDISEEKFLTLHKEFTGHVIVRKWNEQILAGYKIENGEVVGLMKFNEGGNTNTLNASNTTLGETCTDECVPVQNLVCVGNGVGGTGNPPAGDAPPPPEPDCPPTTGECEWVTTCVPDPDEPPIDLPGDGDDDPCIILGLCDPPPPPDDDPPQYDEELIDSLKIDLTDPCFINTINNLSINNGLRSQLGSILTSCFPNWAPNNFIIEQQCYSDTLLDGQHYTSATASTIIIKLNECAINNASQEYVAATLFHELLHAFFTTQGRMSQLQEHESMATAYADALRSTLKEYFPNLSDNEALALAWGGLEGTVAWQNKVQNDPTLVNTYKTLSDNHRWGNSGTNCK